jgi:hypothetical protein
MQIHLSFITDPNSKLGSTGFRGVTIVTLDP